MKEKLYFSFFFWSSCISVFILDKTDNIKEIKNKVITLKVFFLNRHISLKEPSTKSAKGKRIQEGKTLLN